MQRTLPALAALVPTKGDHRPENPYVSYDGSVDDALRPALIAALQAELAYADALPSLTAPLALGVLAR